MQLLNIAVLITGELDAVDAPVAEPALFVGALGAELKRPERPGSGCCSYFRRFGHDLELVNALGALTKAGAQAVRARIATADDQHALIFRADRRSLVEYVAFTAAVLLRQKLHGEVNALKFAAGDVQVAWMLGPACQQDRIIVLGERFHGHIDANVSIGHERDAFGAHLLDSAVNNVLFQLEIGNAVAQQSADAV